MALGQQVNYFGHMNDDSVQMAPFTNMPEDVRCKAAEIKEAISNGKYFAFTGPLKDNTGKTSTSKQAKLLTMHILIQ